MTPDEAEEFEQRRRQAIIVRQEAEDALNAIFSEMVHKKARVRYKRYELLREGQIINTAYGIRAASVRNDEDGKIERVTFKRILKVIS